jgi:hypothetical protein
MNDFLNSKSMITPGVSGALVTLVTATLSSQFGLPAKWIALVTSVVLALVIFFLDQAGRGIVRILVLLVNAAIIFSVSVGANTSATAATAAKSPTTVQSNPPFEEAPAPTPTPFFHSWF